MFRVSRRLDYGLQLMVALAQDEENRPQATALLADRLHIPLPFLHQIGRSLIQGGLIKATPGPRGGLRLHQDPAQITLLQIIETLEGPVRITPEPNNDGEGMVPPAIWGDLQDVLVTYMEKVTLNSLASGRELNAPLAVPVVHAVEHNN
jgi:Rrf2 family cysteine metabolism transcriptional repressor